MIRVLTPYIPEVSAGEKKLFEPTRFGLWGAFNLSNILGNSMLVRLTGRTKLRNFIIWILGEKK